MGNSYKIFEIQIQESTFDATATPTFQIKRSVRDYCAPICALQVYPLCNTIGAVLERQKAPAKKPIHTITKAIIHVRRDSNPSILNIINLLDLIVLCCVLHKPVRFEI